MYESFYNLSESPFRLTPDPRFYYSSATHKRALTHLRFGFHQREGFVVITGKPGTGKTELMLHLLEGLPKERISYGKIVTSNLDANQTLQQVAAAFHIPAEGVKKGILLKKLEDFFLQQVRENRRLVLIIDEAHKLSINSLNELQMLTNFQLSGKVALQCFLSGHDTLKLKLQDPELLHLKQRVITSTFLTPLEKQETQHYIEHRLRCVGWNEDPKFNLTAYSLIHDVTEGIPRQINALCNRILLRAYAEQKHYIDEGMVSRAIDDVQSEPLAATPTDSPMAPLSPQRQSVGDESENIQAMFERSMQQTSVFKPTHHYYDEDETLPLTSAVNFYPTHSNGNVNLGDDGGVYQGQWANNGSVAASTIAQRPGVMPASLSNKQGSMLDSEQDDTLDDARKFSDALTKFHQQTASAESSKTKESGQSVQPAYRGGGQKNAPFHGADTLSAIRRDREKPTKTWVAPLAYGSVAFLLVTLGVTIWIYTFSVNVLGIFEAKNPQEYRFVTAIKGLLDQEQQHPAQDADNKVGEGVDQKLATVLGDKPKPTNEQNEQNEQIVASSTGAVKTDNNSGTVEKWDSGALGGNFLNPKAEQRHSQETTIQSAASELKNDSTITAQQASADATIPSQEASVPVSQADPSGDANNPKTLISKLDETLETEAESLPGSQTAAKPRKTESKTERKTERKTAHNADKGTQRRTGHVKESADDSTQSGKAELATEHPEKGKTNHKIAKSGVAESKSGISKSSKANAITAAKTGVATSKREVAKHKVSTHSKSKEKSKRNVKREMAGARENAHNRISPPEHQIALTSNQRQRSKPKETPKSQGVSKSHTTLKSSKNVVILDNPDEISSTKHQSAMAVPVDTEEAIDKIQLDRLLARLTSAYEKGNLNELLSVLSNDVHSNDGSTRRDLKDGYRKLFNITDMRKMTITSVTWSKKDKFMHGKGEFELRVREKGADTVSSYGGIISMDVENGENGAVITQLNYDYKN